MVGKNGVTESILSEVSTALDSHELIKVRFVEHKDEKKALTNNLTEQLDCSLAGLVGNIAILYRQQENKSLRKISPSR